MNGTYSSAQPNMTFDFLFLRKTDLAKICFVGDDAPALPTAQQTSQFAPPGVPEATQHCQNFVANKILCEFIRMCLSSSHRMSHESVDVLSKAHSQWEFLIARHQLQKIQFTSKSADLLFVSVFLWFYSGSVRQILFHQQWVSPKSQFVPRTYCVVRFILFSVTLEYYRILSPDRHFLQYIPVSGSDITDLLRNAQLLISTENFIIRS